MAQRRGNNEGSIYQRPNGRWTAQISIEGKRAAATFDTQKQCRDWIDEKRMQAKRGLTTSAINTKLGEYLEEWLKSVRSSLRPKSFLQYQGTVQKHILPSLGKVKLAELKPYHIQQLYTQKTEMGESQYTVRMIHRVLYRALKLAEMQGLAATNPARLVIPPKLTPKEMQILTDSQVRRFLTVAAGTRNEMLYRLAVTTGMRFGEILGLKWTDIDWAVSTLSVKRQLQYVRNQGLMLNQLKTRNSVRTVQIGPRTLKLFMDHHGRMEYEIGLDFDPSGLVFVSTNGKPLGQKGIRMDFKSLLLEAQLPEIRFHDLRHTAASLMLSSGMPVIKVARQLGHARPSTTLDIYGHLIPGLESESAARMDELVTPIPLELQTATELQPRPEKGGNEDSILRNNSSKYG